MAAFYDYFNEQKYADAVKNVSALLLPFFHAISLFLFEYISCVKMQVNEQMFKKKSLRVVFSTATFLLF